MGRRRERAGGRADKAQIALGDTLSAEAPANAARKNGGPTPAALAGEFAAGPTERISATHGAQTP